MSDLLSTILAALAEQLREVLRRSYKFEPAAFDGNSASAWAELRLNYGVPLYLQPSVDRTETHISLKILQPKATNQNLYKMVARPGADILEGCIQLRLEMHYQDRCIKTHSRTFELNNPNLFDHMIQWSRSMLGRYSREMTEKLAKLTQAHLDATRSKV